MTDKLHFSLVSPARELYSGEVDHVIAPGAVGEFGVLVNHAPYMTTLKRGLVRVLNEGEPEMRIYVRGGFADVTPEGMTILAEDERNLGEVDADALAEELTERRNHLLANSDDDTERLLAEDQIAFLEDIQNALQP